MTLKVQRYLRAAAWLRLKHVLMQTPPSYSQIKELLQLATLSLQSLRNECCKTTRYVVFITPGNGLQRQKAARVPYLSPMSRQDCVLPPAAFAKPTVAVQWVSLQST